MLIINKWVITLIVIIKIALEDVAISMEIVRSGIPMEFNNIRIAIITMGTIPPLLLAQWLVPSSGSY